MISSKSSSLDQTGHIYSSKSSSKPPVSSSSKKSSIDGIPLKYDEQLQKFTDVKGATQILGTFLKIFDILKIPQLQVYCKQQISDLIQEFDQTQDPGLQNYPVLENLQDEIKVLQENEYNTKNNIINKKLKLEDDNGFEFGKKGMQNQILLKSVDVKKETNKNLNRSELRNRSNSMNLKQMKELEQNKKYYYKQSCSSIISNKHTLLSTDFNLTNSDTKDSVNERKIAEFIAKQAKKRRFARNLPAIQKQVEINVNQISEALATKSPQSDLGSISSNNMTAVSAKEETEDLKEMDSSEQQKTKNGKEEQDESKKSESAEAVEESARAKHRDLKISDVGKIELLKKIGIDFDSTNSLSKRSQILKLVPQTESFLLNSPATRPQQLNEKISPPSKPFLRPNVPPMLQKYMIHQKKQENSQKQ